MVKIRRCAISLVAVLGLTTGARAAEPVELREVAKAGDTTRVTVALTARGLFRVAPQPGAVKKDETKPLERTIEMRLDYVDRVDRLDEAGRPVRAVRHVSRAASAVNGDSRFPGAALRPEVGLLVAEASGGGVFVVSAGGPLTRAELEVVQGPGDPLALPGLLPAKPVAVGDRWPVDGPTAQGLCDYDTISGNTLEATVASLDGTSAVVRLRGEVRGSVLGGDGTVALSGSYTFDRKARRVSKLVLERAEVRGNGPVEAGLDVKSTLTVTRETAATPPALSDAILSGLRSQPHDPRRALLRLTLPGGKASLRHDRDWHIAWDDSRLVVLKRVVKGDVLAQCNVAVGPKAEKGKHVDANTFRDDIKRSLGPRFAQVIGSGEVDGDPEGHYRFKVGVQGRQGELGVVWYYYLVASPEGDQMVANFTMAESRVKVFGAEDEQLMGTFRWEAAPATGTPPG